jgi:hypothetical protein
VPAAEFIYDYLSDLVHPNKGSNLVLLVERDGGPVFAADGESRMGMIIFERIFPYAASMCIRTMGAAAAVAYLHRGGAEVRYWHEAHQLVGRFVRLLLTRNGPLRPSRSSTQDNFCQVRDAAIGSAKLERRVRLP